MPHLGFDLPLPAPGRPLRREHWSTDGIKAMLLPNSGSPSIRVYDPVRDLFTPIVCTGHAGTNVPTEIGLMNFASINGGIDIAADSSTILPTDKVTILLIHRKTDTTVRAGTAFGVDGGVGANRCGAHVPYNDGTIYWDYGGSTDGTTEVRATGLPQSLSPRAWVFTAGPPGMAIYMDGALLNSHSTPAGRSSTTAPFLLNQGNGGGTSDLHEVSFFALLDAVWNEEQVKEWWQNQTLLFAPSQPMGLRYFTPPGPNGWDIWIDGTSVKDKIEQKSTIIIKLQRGELSEMRFKTVLGQNYVPDQFKDVYAFDDDGAKLFGGIVRYRTVVPTGTTSRQADVTCQSWWFFLTVSLVTVQFEGDVTLKEIVESIIAQLPAEYGIALHPDQPDGPTFERPESGGYAFDSGENIRASELVRRLETDTADLGAYLADLTATKYLGMFAAGTVIAPVSLTDATPNCTVASWRDSNDTIPNHIKLICGSADEGGVVSHTWPPVDGSTFVFALEGENIPSNGVSPGYVTVNGNFEPLWPPEAPDPDGIEFDPNLDSGTLTFRGASQALLTAGVEITLQYQPQRPFTVEVSTGATPRISDVRTNTKIHTWVDGLSAANGLLAQLGQGVKELDVLAKRLNVFRPSQLLTVQLTQLDLDDDFTIGPVTIVKKYDQWWESSFSAQNTTIPKPGKLERFRNLIASVAGR